MLSIENENKKVFDLEKNKSNIIKIVGVGGSGCNAVSYMYKQGIKGVDYIICNTDAQALENSDIPNKIQLGVTTTQGLGAGNKPEVGKEAAEESKEIISKNFENAKMVFITAGMGGGTGTGAAPVIAEIARSLGILTVAIVTTPFSSEGARRKKQANEGVEKLKEIANAYIIINNDKITEIYGDLPFSESLKKADEILLIAAKSIAEVISKPYEINIDFNDVNTVLQNGGATIMSTAVASGENRAHEAVTKALTSPLLDNNKITDAQNVLLLIVSGKKEITQREVGYILNHIQDEAGNEVDVIHGIGKDENLFDEDISVTIVASGFSSSPQNENPFGNRKKLGNHIEPITQTEPKEEINPADKIIAQADIKIIDTLQKEAVQAVKLADILVDCEVLTPQSFKIITKPAQTQQEPKAHQMELYFHENSQSIENQSVSDYENKYMENNKDSFENSEQIYSLAEYSRFEKKLSEAQAESNNEIFSVYIDENTDQFNETHSEDEKRKPIDPFNSSVAEVMEAKLRNSNLGKYNHSFGANRASSLKSRTSIAKDSAGEIQIRKDNPFLHDVAD